MEQFHNDQIKTAIQRFVQMPDEDWNLFTPSLSYTSLKKGEHWISEGQREHYMGFVLEGNMRHYYTRDGEEKTTYFYFENHLVGGYISSLTAAPSLLTIEALTDCKLLKFSY
ncbi:MAG: cyclic nucleotide-binding domain-containing protein, partial [Sphingobacteriales bacterium]